MKPSDQIALVLIFLLLTIIGLFFIAQNEREQLAGMVSGPEEGECGFILFEPISWTDAGYPTFQVCPERGNA